MNTQEKRAWFVLAVFGATMAVYALAVAMIGFRQEAFAVFSVFALTAGEGVIGRREKKAGRVILDERDQEINRLATVAGYSIFWVVFVLAAMAPFFIKGPNATITLPTTMLGMVVIVAMMIVMTARALVVAILYWRDARGTQA
ncbi:MAG: hypothetical protein M1457_04525 [bacterium]|nr:hypothetical protein [bacterium]